MSEIQQVKRGTLVRHVPMRLVDVSLSGCLVEAEQDLDVGTRGTLEVDLWGVPCRYPIRVSRVMERPEPVTRVESRASSAGETTWSRRRLLRLRRSPHGVRRRSSNSSCHPIAVERSSPLERSRRTTHDELITAPPEDEVGPHALKRPGQ